MAAPRRMGHNQNYNASTVNNRQAQLTNAYQELAKELGSDRLKVVGGYTLGRVIGEGTFGSVHLATHRLTGARCAIKKIPKSCTPQLTREIHHHRMLHHPSIVHLHEIIATESHIWLVTELCSGGELFDYLVERGRMLEGEARRLFGELTVAVGWMHRRGVVHRDLKLENVLLDGELKVKLGDLGFAREWQKGRLMETFCGTTGYASPEMLSGRKYLGEETDIWSLGIILYILLCGGLPFDDDDERVMKDLILKGEYEEPEWLSEEARSLIRGMLQQDPAKRLSIDGILTHPWFKMTLVDRIQGATGDSHSVPPSPHPTSPLSGEEFFAEPFNRTSSSSRLPHVAAPSPLSLHQSTVPYSGAPSDTSVDLSEGKTNSAVTTPPTSTDDDGVHRVNSCEFSATEKALELLHPNSSQSTIRRVESPATGSTGRNRVASKTTLEGQVEEDEGGEEENEGPASLPNLDDNSLHLPVAGHSRTPSRTKRRSVSSTLSVERRHSHHSTSGQWQRYHPEDYLAKLNEERPPPFSTSSEKHLLSQLNDMGLDIGQLRHSVENDACDSSAAMWWILRAKQAERGETDEVIEARAATAARKREKAAAYAREERRRAREASAPSRDHSPEVRSPAVTFKEEISSIPVTPTFTVMDLGAPIAGPSRPIVASPENLATSPSESLGVSPPFELKPPPNMLAATAAINTAKPPPSTPPRETPIASPEVSPAQRERTKTRSPSMTMLQRATSAWVGTKKTEDDTTSPATSDKRSTSPTKLHKPPPKPKTLPRSESDNTMLSNQAGPSTPISTPQRERPAPLPLKSPMSHLGTAVNLSDDNHAPLKSPTHSITAEELVGGSSKQKGSKRDSLWTTFRHLFNEDKRRRKRNPPGSPLSSEVKMAPAVVLSRGANARAPYINRTPAAAPGSRRTSLDGRPPLYSRRSSSINSRRSSFDGGSHLHEHADLVGNLSLKRRTSQRSHGSQTPTSDREYVDYPSRPGSSNSLQRGNSRRSSMSMRSPSLQSDNASGRFKPGAPPSPLHNYRRRAPGGNDSSRVRHIRVIPESQVLRPSSVASSIKSNASSRASSVEGRRGDSEFDDSGRDETASLRSQRRRKGEGRKHSLAQQIHRTRSPLSAGAQSDTSGPGKKGPIRDVFQKNKDDDWISEEEEEYAGGLGQGNTSTSTSVSGTSASVVGKMWVNGTRAAAFPNANASASSMKMSTPIGKRRGRRTSLEEKEESQQSNRNKGETKGLGIGVENSGRVRRGLPPNRSAAPVIEEEEEEEE
ncbi:CAMK/CAMKL protein kinase [Kwoniella heveanensis CBS 569]|nr:CAMK/CAMKL protein kinase [Kwoniella heveanensis CBS 569]